MFKKFLAIALVGAMLASLDADVFAGKTSSGSSSSAGRSSSTGSSSSRSYGSGGSVRSTPSSSSSSSRPSSFGSSPSSRPSTPTPTPTASGSGNRSYGSGTSSSSVRTTPATGPPIATGGSNRSYGSGYSTSSSPANTGTRTIGVTSSTANPRVDQAGVTSRQHTESQRRYEESQRPRPTPTSTSTTTSAPRPAPTTQTQAPRPSTTYRDQKTGQSVPMRNNDPSVVIIRHTVDHDRYVYRDRRLNDFYGTVYVGRPIVRYSDPYGPFFWFWLMDRSADDRALWAYHHRSQFDAARLDALRANDSEFDSRLRAIEARGVVADPTYVPTALEDDPDLMFNDDYVTASYNPVTITAMGFWTFLKWCFYIIVIVTIVWFFVWFIFIRETEG